MHILFVESGYPVKSGGGGGAGTYVQLIGKELVKAGYTISVIASPDENANEFEFDEGIEVYRPSFQKTWIGRVVGRMPYFWRYSKLLDKLTNQGLYKKLLAIHARKPIDVIEFTEGGDLWNAVKQTFPYLVHLHGSGYTFKANSGRKTTHFDWLFRQLELIGIRRAKMVVAPCQAMIRLVEQEAGVTFSRKRVIPYPIDNRLLDKLGSDKKSDDQSKVVLFAARNDKVKGADTLLEAIPEIEKQHPEVEFRFFGFEPREDQHLPESVKSRAFIPKDELLREYQKADVCVVPSYFDNSPNTVYEAMAAGKPVVATNVGGIPELVSNGENGKIIEPHRPEQLASAIDELLKDPDRCRSMGIEGRKRIKELGDIQKNLKERVAVYREVSCTS